MGDHLGVAPLGRATDSFAGDSNRANSRNVAKSGNNNHYRGKINHRFGNDVVRSVGIIRCACIAPAVGDGELSVVRTRRSDARRIPV